ncbi:MAG: hypothetical protein WC565_09040 [Parcubacteria group bacterium]|nr:hypothetical protein [Candidatus Krumholzibacteria bacterium]
MGATGERKDQLERKAYFARVNHEENEKGAKRYFALVGQGVSGEEAREVVKKAFGWGDRRLDNVLTTRASSFGPGTVAELEAIAVTAIRRAEISAAAEIRFYDGQLQELEDALERGERHYEIRYSVGSTEKTGDSWKSERLPIREAQARLLEKISAAALKPVEALKIFKADKIVVNSGDGLSGRSFAELERMEQELKDRRVNVSRETQFEEVGEES